MTTAKSGDQDVEVGDVFVEITEKTQFPGLRFFRGWNMVLSRGKRRLPEKTALRRIKDLGICDMLKPNPGAKMEILDEILSEVHLVATRLWIRRRPCRGSKF